MQDSVHYHFGKEYGIPLLQTRVGSQMGNSFSLQWIIGVEDEGKLLREFLHEIEISRTALTDIKFKGGKILINHDVVTVRYRLKKDDLLTVVFPPEEPSNGMVPENIPLHIVYEDDYVLVIDKQPNMATIPSREHPYGTLANALLYYYKEHGLMTTVHIVTRLDRDTSGLVLVAKHRHVHHLLSKQHQTKLVKRRYEAFVHGQLKQDAGSIHKPIGRKQDSIIERMVRDDGQAALTHFEVLRRYQQFSHVSLQLETGRTHQIRVHMADFGHPLLGDDLYGGEKEFITRQALHSSELSFWHPFLKKELTFTSSLPNDMAELLHKKMLH